jgi:peptide/nickel transport system permease protein
MTRFLLSRMTHAVLLLFGVSLLTFLFTALAPGDYFEEMRLDPRIGPETVSALRTRFGLDRPLAVRYASWLKSVVRGDLGYSFSYNSPAGPLLWARARSTLLLTFTATLLTWGLALPLGIWSAERLGKIPDTLISWAMAALLVIPDLVIALGLLLLAVRSGWFPTGGMASVNADALTAGQRIGDLGRHLILPVAVLVFVALPVVVRHVRAAMIGVLDAPFLRVARGHGIRRHRLLYRYALPAAANPLISLFGLSIGALISGSLIVEITMSWPGIGPFMVEAILARDIYVVLGGVLLSTCFLIAGNFCADLILYWADPRIRAGSEEK